MAAIYIGLGLILLLLLYNILLSRSKTTRDVSKDIKPLFEGMSTEIDRIESSLRNEITANRKELSDNLRSGREELAGSLKVFGELIKMSMESSSNRQQVQLDGFSLHLQSLTKSIEEKLSKLTTTIETKLKESHEGNTVNSRENRKEIKEALDFFRTDFSKSVGDFNKLQNDNFHLLIQKQSDQNASTDIRLDQMRGTLEKKISELQNGNEKKLDEMRATVDEKLQKTLEVRLGESFRLVSDRLEAVHKGLGDMQQLATGVGDLKKVLTNVKSRGILGEYQLENLLEQLLTNDQYAKNVKTKEGSNAIVEFAVRLPGRREDSEKALWLPIDSKFPKEAFELLLEAYDNGTPEAIAECKKTFAKGIKDCAYDICSKYIDPPNTTDFAILFLPFESLYAEVLRMPGLFESIQRECKINIAGPTTLSAFLSSLQMGFRTLAIERRSSEVWELLGAVKTEFGHFGGILDKTQKKLQQASEVIEKASVRSRAIERKLKTVQELPKEQAVAVFEDTTGIVEVGESTDNDDDDDLISGS